MDKLHKFFNSLPKSYDEMVSFPSKSKKSIKCDVSYDIIELRRYKDINIGYISNIYNNELNSLFYATKSLFDSLLLIYIVINNDSYKINIYRYNNIDKILQIDDYYESELEFKHIMCIEKFNENISKMITETLDLNYNSFIIDLVQSLELLPITKDIKYPSQCIFTDDFIQFILKYDNEAFKQRYLGDDCFMYLYYEDLSKTFSIHIQITDAITLIYNIQYIYNDYITRR